MGTYTKQETITATIKINAKTYQKIKAKAVKENKKVYQVINELLESE